MGVLTELEIKQIMSEVFYSFIDKDQKVLAMAFAAERIRSEIEESELKC
jgi:hypothetical protein